MTPKLKAILAASVAGITSFLGWLATIPPESQNHLVGPLVDIMPLDWRPNIGLAMRALASVSTMYSVYSAAHSSQATPLTK